MSTPLRAHRPGSIPRPATITSDSTVSRSGGWKPKNLLIVQFPDADAIHSWARSTDYEEMVAVVSQSAEMSTVAVSSHSE